VAHYNTILHQLLCLIPRHHFDARVRQSLGDRYVKKFSTWNQLTVLLYAQASGKASLRDLENGLDSQTNHLYHLGLPQHIARSTVADANTKRDYRVYEDLFYRLLERCQAIAPKHGFSFKNPLFSLDSTVIDLCLRAIPWARHTRTRGALRLHYGLDHSGNIPNFLAITTRRSHELTIAKKHWPIIPDSINCFDRGYVDTDWFRRIHDGGAFFVTRLKKNLTYLVAGQQEIPGKKSKGSRVTCDRIIEFTVPRSRKSYPYQLRLVTYFDAPSKRWFRFLTNNFELDAQSIADIYRARWQIEAFFRWIKQNLKIKAFLGTSKNAVMSQIWVAMCYYLMLAFIKFQARYAYSLFYLHRIIRETLLDRFSLIDVLRLRESRLSKIRDPEPQLAFTF
jgi:hypothetical protein